MVALKAGWGARTVVVSLVTVQAVMARSLTASAGSEAMAVIETELTEPSSKARLSLASVTPGLRDRKSGWTTIWMGLPACTMAFAGANWSQLEGESVKEGVME